MILVKEYVAVNGIVVFLRVCVTVTRNLGALKGIVLLLKGLCYC